MLRIFLRNTVKGRSTLISAAWYSKERSASGWPWWPQSTWWIDRSLIEIKTDKITFHNCTHSILFPHIITRDSCCLSCHISMSFFHIRSLYPLYLFNKTVSFQKGLISASLWDFRILIYMQPAEFFQPHQGDRWPAVLMWLFMTDKYLLFLFWNVLG